MQRPFLEQTKVVPLLGEDVRAELDAWAIAEIERLVKSFKSGTLSVKLVKGKMQGGR